MMNSHQHNKQSELTGSRLVMALEIRNISVCMGLAAIKIVGGVLGGSHALVCDGIESLTDIFSSTVVWGGLKIGERPPDDNHPFGHGRAESLAALIVSLTLMGVAIGIAAQSVREIMLPHEAPAPWTLIVLLVVIMVKEAMARMMFKTARAVGCASLKVDAWHSRSDVLTSLAAFIGIAVAVIGGDGYESADAWAALFASGVIFFNGGRMLRVAVSEIMDEAVSTEFADVVRKQASSVDGVQGIEKCLIRKSGIYYFVEIHVMVGSEISVREGHDIGHQVKERLLLFQTSILDVVTHIEPVEEETTDRNLE
jgi:cation diffusion facilitator family transporter